MAIRDITFFLKVTLMLVLSLNGADASSYSKFSSKSLVKENWNKSVNSQDDVKSLIDQGRVFTQRKSAFILNHVPRGGKDVAQSETKSDGYVTRFINWIQDSKTRSWVVLFTAILMEIAATAFMKTASTDDNVVALCISMVLYILCLSLFGLTMKQIEMGVAYAVWSGLGTAITTTVGIVCFNEARHIAKIAFVGLILCGCVGLNLVDSE